MQIRRIMEKIPSIVLDNWVCPKQLPLRKIGDKKLSLNNSTSVAMSLFAAFEHYLYIYPYLYAGFKLHLYIYPSIVSH